MFGLDKIVLNNALTLDNDGENIYSPYIRGFSTYLNPFTHVGQQPYLVSYLKINTTEFGSSQLRKLRAIHVQGQIRSLEDGSRLIACHFTHSAVFRIDDDGLEIDFQFEPANNPYSPQLYETLNVTPCIAGFAEADPLNQVEYSVQEFSNVLNFRLLVNKGIIAASNITKVYTSGIYYVI